MSNCPNPACYCHVPVVRLPEAPRFGTGKAPRSAEQGQGGTDDHPTDSKPSTGR